MSNRYEFVNFLNAHDKFRDNDEGVKFDSFEAERTLNHYWNLLNQQDQKIKDLEHRLANCIEPKFKIGQEVWSIFISKYFKDCREICNLEITAIMKCNNGIYYQGYVLEKGKNRSDYWFNEENTFLTEEEARKKLEELKNG